MKLKQFQHVEVTWEDATSHSGWHDEDSCDLELQECKTVGYVYRVTKRSLQLAPTKAASSELADMWAIPRACITRIRVIRGSR